MRNAYSKHTVKDATVTITDGTYEYVLEVPEVELMLYSIHNDDPWMHSGTLFTHFEGEASMLTLRKLSDEEDGRDENAARIAEIASHDPQAAIVRGSGDRFAVEWDCGMILYCDGSTVPRTEAEFCILHAQTHGLAKKP